MDKEWSRFWWKNITGANYIVTSVINHLLDGTGVALIVPSDLPWRSKMRLVIEEAFRGIGGSSEILVSLIDAEDECSEEESVGSFLLNKFGQSREIRNGYRERGKNSIQDYLKKKEVFKNKVIWVKGAGGKTAKKWIEFCQEYSSGAPEHGLFVLEVHDIANVYESPNLKPIYYEDNISTNDIQLFNEFMVSDDNSYNTLWKEYIAVVSACLCETDAEISELLIRENNFKTESPEEGLKRIADMGEYKRRGGDVKSGHVLALIRNNDFNEIHHRIWVAQVKTLYPVIEFERNEMINKYKKDIESVLRSVPIKQFNRLLTKAEDVELGTLVYMLSSSVDSSGYKLLYMPDDKDRERIFFLHDCRNQIAHTKICSPEQIQRLASYYDKKR